MMNSQSIQQHQHTFEGHAARIFSLALCTLPNGTRIAASASHDRTVRLWNLSDFTHMRTIQYSDFVWRVFLVTTVTGRVCIVAFISAEDKIYVSDLESNKELHMVTGRLVFAGPISLYKSPVIITLVNEIDIKIVDAETGICLRHIRGGFEKAFRAVVSHGSNPILIFNTWNAQNRRSSIQGYELCQDSDVDSIDAVGAQALKKSSSQSSLQPALIEGPFDPAKMKVIFEGDSRDGITSLGISQTAKPLICSGHYDNVVRVWDLSSLSLLLILEGHNDWVVSVAIWKGVEPIVVSGSSDGTIKLWDLQTGDLITTCEGHQRDVWAVTVTTGPQHLIVSASADRTVRVWDTNSAICDMKWDRRRDFCMFLCSYGLLERPSSRPRPPPAGQTVRWESNESSAAFAGDDQGGVPAALAEDVGGHLRDSAQFSGDSGDEEDFDLLFANAESFLDSGMDELLVEGPTDGSKVCGKAGASPSVSSAGSLGAGAWGTGESENEIDDISSLLNDASCEGGPLSSRGSSGVGWGSGGSGLQAAKVPRPKYATPAVTEVGLAIVTRVLQTQHLCKEIAAFI